MVHIRAPFRRKDTPLPPFSALDTPSKQWTLYHLTLRLKETVEINSSLRIPAPIGNLKTQLGLMSTVQPMDREEITLHVNMAARTWGRWGNLREGEKGQEDISKIPLPRAEEHKNWCMNSDARFPSCVIVSKGLNALCTSVSLPVNG